LNACFGAESVEVENVPPREYALMVNGGGGFERTIQFNIVKVAFVADGYMAAWKENGTFNAKKALTDDSANANVTWTISGHPTATISNDGKVTFSDSYWYTDATDGEYIIRATHTHLYSCTDSTKLVVVGALECSNVLVKRKNKDIFNLEYGHWWLERGSESYGWWPKGLSEKMGEQATLTEQLWNTFTGVEGELNGVTDYRGGTLTRDPHHGDPYDEIIDVYILSHRTRDEAWEDLRTFAQSYEAGWSWPFGDNCNTFQMDMLEAGEYMTESECEELFE
jgi:hypothetical protein